VGLSANGHRGNPDGYQPDDGLDGDIGPLIDSLRALFARDRRIASQPNSARCGICYLYFSQDDLVYREEEGFYVCAGCARALGVTRLKMLRRQQR